ncbi:hypothetical protein SUGI_0511560 [Cryptomeria japonica]|nr:hypothetical protein SUGI_0511560 [Cryptomeria japonica]
MGKFHSIGQLPNSKTKTYICTDNDDVPRNPINIFNLKDIQSNSEFESKIVAKCLVADFHKGVLSCRSVHRHFHCQVCVNSDSSTFATVLPVCAKFGAFEQGYAMHGYRNDVLKLFEQMKHSGTNPDHIT